MKTPDRLRGPCLLLAAGFVLALVAGRFLMRTPTEIEKAPEPVVLTLWHYYNGVTQNALDELTTRFNATEGARMGVAVRARSLGDVPALAEAVFQAARKDMGAATMPDLFAAYPENAFRVAQVAELADLEPYFTPEELADYRPEFLEDGRLGPDRGLVIFPVAKSTENLFVNRTAWDAFASATGADLDDLATWEGVARTAGRYHQWSGGRAFFRLDSPANFLLVTARQLGETPYELQDGRAVPTISPRLARALWNAYHVPFVRGWYARLRPFCTDDARTGVVIAYVGSSAGAGYFPSEVTGVDGAASPIACAVLPYPRFQEGEPHAILQGAGLCVAKSTPERERAAARFLRWLTMPEQNLPFAALSGYLPATKAAQREELILDAMPKTEPGTVQTAVACSLRTSLTMLDAMRLAGTPPFAGSYELRMRWNALLPECAAEARDELQRRTAAGEDEDEALADLLSDRAFEQWRARLERESAAALLP